MENKLLWPFVSCYYDLANTTSAEVETGYNIIPHRKSDIAIHKKNAILFYFVFLSFIVPASSLSFTVHLRRQKMCDLNS